MLSACRKQGNVTVVAPLLDHRGGQEHPSDMSRMGQFINVDDSSQRGA
jgi:hypothetical protein